MDFLLQSERFEFDIIKYAFFVALAGAIICLIFGKWMVSLGLLAGVVGGSWNFFLLSWSVRRMVKLPKSRAGFAAVSGQVTRFILACLLLGAAAYTRNFSFFIGTVIGYFMIKGVIMVFALIGKVKIDTDFDFDTKD